MTVHLDESIITGTRGDVRLDGDQVQEARHRRLGVEQRLVHVDVDHLGAVLDLLPGDLDGLVVAAVQDEPREGARAGDVGPLADVDEQRIGPDVERLEAGQARPRLERRDRRAAARPATAAAIARVWSGVVPQQPPTRLSAPSRASWPRTPLVSGGCSS